MDDYRRDRVEKSPNHGEDRRNQDYIGIEHDSSRNEEFAAEFTADDYQRRVHREEDTNTMYGWIGILLSVLSYFFWPVVLGGAGIILGFVSRNRGAETLGNIAIAAGVISILITFFLLPFI